MYCLDANVWIYYFDEELEEHDLVGDAVGELIGSELLFTTTILQMEVVHYLQNNLEESDAMVDEFLGLEGVTVADLLRSDVQRASELLAQYPHSGIGGRDATVLAALERADVTELWTHDQALYDAAREHADVTVRDPANTD